MDELLFIVSAFDTSFIIYNQFLHGAKLSLWNFDGPCFCNASIEYWEILPKPNFIILSYEKKVPEIIPHRTMAIKTALISDKLIKREKYQKNILRGDDFKNVG